MTTERLKILAVSSGKGGVGKTTVTLNIARQLSLAGFRTLIVDFDIHNKGATCLFMDAVAKSQVQSITHVMGRCSNSQNALQLADQFPVLKLEYGDTLFLVPAARPDEMAKWEIFVCDIPTIVQFLGAFIRAIAERNQIDIVLIDCYGGVDTLTLSAAGIADDFIIINEPDVITFAGTLLLYKQLESTYGACERPPRVHFVINRISGKYSFRFLRQEYQKHLSQLAVDRTVLAYLPFDKLVFDTFGDYPFFSELLPKGLYAKKMLELIARLWPEPRFTGLAAWSPRKHNRIYQKTAENPFADPERIFQVWKMAPAWALLPITALILLYLAPVNQISFRSFHLGPLSSLSFFTLRSVFYVSLLLVLSVVLVGILFEPFQISRWLLRKATYEKRRRQLLSGRSISGYLHTLWDRSMSCTPAIIGFVCFCAIALTVDGLDLMPPFRNIAIWRGQIHGFYPNGNYHRLILARQAVIRPGTDMSKTNLEDSELTQVLLPSAKLNGTQAQRAIFDHAKLLGAELEGADLSGTNGTSADFAGAHAPRVDFQGANLINASLWGADLTEAVFKDAVLYKTDFRQSNLEGANFSGAVIKDTMFDGADLRGADFANANLDYLDRQEQLDLLSLLYTQKAHLKEERQAFGKLWASLLRTRKQNSDDAKAPWWLDWDPSQPAHLKDIIQPAIQKRTEDLLHPSANRRPQLLPKSKKPIRPSDLLILLKASPKDSTEFGTRTDLMELLLIRGGPEDFQTARVGLQVLWDQLHPEQGAPRLALRPGEDEKVRVQHEGITCVLKLLLGIVSKDGSGQQSLAAWQQWLAQNHQLTGWEWKTWDDNFVARKYGREQNMKIRAIQLSAGTANDSQNNLTCDQMTLWFDSGHPCPRPSNSGKLSATTR